MDSIGCDVTEANFNLVWGKRTRIFTVNALRSRFPPAKIALEGRAAPLFDHNKAAEILPDSPLALIK